MRLHLIPLVCVVLPAVGVHLCYLLAAQLGHVPWCFPYIEGCVSISAAGRQSPESHVFRATVIPTAVLMMMYWKLDHAWLETLKSGMKTTNRAMLWCGITACLGLILYTTTLGAIGQAYEVLRRTGVMLFYVLTFLAQILMTGQIAVVAKARPSVISRRLFRGLSAICLAILLLGSTSLLLPVLYWNYESIEDSFEWLLTLLIMMHFLVTYFTWKGTGFRASFTVSKQ